MEGVRQPFLNVKLMALMAHFWGVTLIWKDLCKFCVITGSFDYLDAIWFLMVTCSTVGYGDVSPKTVLGKIAVMFFLCSKFIINIIINITIIIIINMFIIISIIVYYGVNWVHISYLLLYLHKEFSCYFAFVYSTGQNSC